MTFCVYDENHQYLNKFQIIIGAGGTTQITNMEWTPYFEEAYPFDSKDNADKIKRLLQELEVKELQGG